MNNIIQLVINTNMLREINEHKLILAYARLLYINEEDVTKDTKIRSNLETLLNWDILGENGFSIYCGKFESIKKKDWEILIQLIKDNSKEIKFLAPVKKKRIELYKSILNKSELKEKKNKERFLNSNYEVSGRGKKAIPCTYDGITYKSRQECQYKEGLTKAQLYKYLKATGQLHEKYSNN